MKKLSIRKVLCALLSIAMICGMFAGCSAKEDTPATTRSTDPISLEDANTTQTEFEVMAGISALNEGYDKNTLLQEMQQTAGISITWNAMNEGLTEQVNIRIAGDDLPDAFQSAGISELDIATMGADGTIIDLTPYITPEIMPNLYKIFEEYPEYKTSITYDDGAIYSLPSAALMGTAAVGADEDYQIGAIPQYAMINKAWLDYLNLEIPTNIEELETVLQAFADNDMSHTYYGNDAGTTIPLSIGFDEWCWGQNIFYAAFGFTNWNGLNYMVDDNGQVYHVASTDGYRDAVTWFSGLYNKGLVDTEMFSVDSSQYIARCSSGYVGVGVWWYIEELMGDKSEDYVFLPFLCGEDGTYGVDLHVGTSVGRTDLLITKECESPANLLKFYDLWYTGESYMQLNYAPIDIYYYNGQDENGRWIALSEEESVEKYGISAGELKGRYEVYGPKLCLSEYYETTFNMEPRAIERLEDLWNYWLAKVDTEKSHGLRGDLTYTVSEKEIDAEYASDFDSYVQEMEALWIKNGGPTDAEWEAYLESLKAWHMDELVQVRQDAYDRYLEKSAQ